MLNILDEEQELNYLGLIGAGPLIRCLLHSNPQDRPILALTGPFVHVCKHFASAVMSFLFLPIPSCLSTFLPFPFPPSFLLSLLLSTPPSPFPLHLKK